MLTKFSSKLIIPILVFAFAFRILNLGHPETYIFDEVYHAFTAREYLEGRVEAWTWWATPPEGLAYEWTHPPLAKYGMVLGMQVFGQNSFGWRFGSAFMGTLSIFGLYLLVLSLTKNKTTALLAAFLLSLEGLHLSQSRIAMNDTYMLCFYIWALYAAAKTRWKSAALLFGLALSSKWSAIYGLLPLALLYLHQFPLKNWTIKTGALHFLLAVRLLLIALSIYVLTYTPFILSGFTWAQWWELHRQMWYYHTNLVATHAYQSTPWQWIFGVRPVWYWVSYGEGVKSNIYVFPNPLLLWAGLVALVLQLKKILRFPYFLLYTLYFILFLPWVFSPRIMFFYHYLPSATFLMVILATWLSTLTKKQMWLAILLSAISYILISPFLYGFPTPSWYWDLVFAAFPSWK